MGATLIINPGSSSKKIALFKDGALHSTWHFEQTGQGFSVCTEREGTRGLCSDITASEFSAALTKVRADIIHDGLVADDTEISQVGIRIVAPASHFAAHRRIDDDYIERLETLTPLAPHHIPNTVSMIKSVRSVLPQANLIGVSDSAFHKTVPRPERAVSLNAEDEARFDIKKFGYHGISVASIVKHVLAKEGSVPERMIVCHVGSGVSVTALQHGESIATSMGYTPASGLMMSSRAGDLPADMLAGLAIRKGLKKDELFSYLYEEGGFKGVTGVRDLRLVLDQAAKNDRSAEQALNMFAGQVKDHIAMYAMQMGGVDTIVLTATAAERNPVVRMLLVADLPLLNTRVDFEKNESLLNSEGYIHTDDSAVKLLVLKTDELGEMYRVVSTFT